MRARFPPQFAGDSRNMVGSGLKAQGSGKVLGSGSAHSLKPDITNASGVDEQRFDLTFAVAYESNDQRTKPVLTIGSWLQRLRLGILVALQQQTAVLHRHGKGRVELGAGVHASRIRHDLCGGRLRARAGPLRTAGARAGGRARSRFRLREVLADDDVSDLLRKRARRDHS